MSNRHFAIHAIDEAMLKAPLARLRESHRADLRTPKSVGSTARPGGWSRRH